MDLDSASSWMTLEKSLYRSNLTFPHIFKCPVYLECIAQILVMKVPWITVTHDINMNYKIKKAIKTS